MKKKLRSTFLLESLEPRLLFSADLAPLPVDGGVSGPEAESGLEISLRPDNGGVQAADTHEQLRQEIIFVDGGVDDYQRLIFDLESQLETGRQFDIVKLDSDDDGIDQISAYLRQQQDVDAVHFVSHGADGEVVLGNSRLNATTLEGYAEAIEGWQRALSGDADLLFYGCDLAAGNDGQDLINSLTLLSGADVAASNDVTGSAKLGGDWELEYSQGQIETAVATRSATQQNWNGVLATFIVNTTADTIDDNLGDGDAEDAAGNTSLRAAIMEANALGGSHTIVLGADTYSLTITGSGENAAATGDLDITADITITGVDAESTIIDATGLGDRVFHIDNSSTANIARVTIQGGDQNNGGGIFVDNSATLNLSDAILQNNISDRGGAIHVHGTANLDRVLLYNNSVTKPGPGDGEGGAIHFHGADGGTLTNVTISGNSAEDSGGGLWTNSSITVANSTITLNDAPNGGGIVNSGGTVDISNTIVAENTASSDPDVAGTFNSQGYNLIGDKGAVTDFTQAGDQAGTAGSPIDPMLDSLKNNGGFTPTHALLAGSPAIDPAGLSGAPPHDQRGFVRDVTPDIGAFEYNGTNTAPTLTVTGAATVKKGTVYTLSLSASDPDSHTITSWTINWGDGTIETIPGNPSSVTHTYTQAGFTYNITVSATDVTGTYIAGDLISTSMQTHSLMRFDATTGNFLQEFGKNDVSSPIDVQIGPDGGIYVTGFNSHNVFRYDADGSSGSEFVGAGDGGLWGASRMAFGPDGNLYVTSMNTDEVLRYDGVTGNFIDVFADSVLNPLDEPDGITFGPDGDLYVASRGTGEILRFDGTTGNYDGVFATHGFMGYMDIHFGPDGNLWVTNQTSDDIRRYDGADGTYLGVFSSTGASDFAGIAFGPDNRVYMSDAITVNDKIIRYPIGDGSSPEDFILKGPEGLNQPVNIVFTPAHQVTVVANNAPTATNLTSTSAYNEGDGSVAITDIVVSDVDTGETITATLTLNDTATGSLSANDGATYDGGTGVWTITDTVANVNTALANLVFNPNVNNDVDTFIDVVIDDGDEDGSGPITGTISLNVIQATADLYLTTEGNVTSGGQDGLSTWNDEDLITIGDPNLSFGAGTTGTFAMGIDLTALTSGANVDAAHLVSRDMQIGSSNFQLRAGDLLLSDRASSATYTSDTAFPLEAGFSAAITPDQNDVIIFRPDTPGDYTRGQFGLLIDNMVGTPDDLMGFTLIEQDITVGGYALEAGDFLYTTDEGGGQDNKIRLYETGTVGSGSTPINRHIFLDGDDPFVDIPREIQGIELLEQSTLIGNQVLAAGTILTHVDEPIPVQVGSNNLFVDQYDIFALNVTTSSLVGAGNASASLFFDGSSVNFGGVEGNDEDLGAIALRMTGASANDAPTATNMTSTSFYNEGDGTVAINNIVVSDVDTGETISATLTLVNTATGSLSANDGASYDGGTGIWTISGSVSAVNTALANLVFTPNANNDVDTTITTHIEDAAGAGPADGIITLDVTPANDAPTATNMTSTSFYNEGDGTVAINNIVVSDVDTGETISATLTLVNTATGSLSANDGASYDGGTGIWTISGSVSAVNTALANLVFTPNANNDVDTTITTHIEDAAGAGPADGIITLDVTPANDAPTATNMTSTSFYNEGDGTVAINNIVVSDVDTGETISATLTLVNTATGSLSANDGASYDGGTGIWTISGSVSAVNTALANLVFTPNANNDVDTTITTHIEDAAGAGPADGIITLDVTPANDAPTATNMTSTSFYNEGDGTVAINNIVVSDVDTGETISATLTLVNTATGSLSANDGASYDGGTGIWTISGSVSAVNTALANLVFTPNANNDVDTTITTHIEDAAGAGPADGIITLDVTPANDAPTATNMTSTSFYNEGDGTVAINNIVVSDVDTGETISATLTLVNTATGSLSANDGASYDGGTGIWTISGSVSAVNTALANLVFTPNANNDVDTTITTHIEDAAGAGPADGIITLDVTPANDAPTATNMTSTSFYNEGDGTVAINNIVVSDVDTGETISATLTLVNTATGSLSANDGASYDGGTGIWTISGSVSAVNTALANLVFTPNANNDVDTTITTHIEDAAGAGPADGIITLDVTPANDAPTATNMTSTSFYNEGDGTVAINNIVVSDVDTGETISATLTLVNTATGSLSANDGASYDGGTGIWTISGSVSAVNTALANLVFTPNANNDVDTTITTHIEDAAGAGPADGIITLDVTPANDAPTATNMTSTSFYNEGDGTVAINNIVVSDVDTGETISATLTLVNTATGSLSANDGASYDGGTGIWTISGSVSAVNTALANLVFTPNANNDVDTTITTHIEDAAGAGPADGIITLDVTPANDAPTATNMTSTSFYNEGDGTVAINNIVVSDVDTGETISATLTLVNTATGSLSANDGASYDGGTGIWTISGSVSAVNTALANLVFTPNANNDVDTTITTHIEDAAGAGPADGIITLDVTPANDPGTVTIDNTTPAQGDTLTASVIDPDGVSGAISYQWFSDGAAIGGALGKTYTTVQADVGTVITVTADYSDDLSTVESLTSAGTAAVTNVNDTPVTVNDNLNATEDHSMTITSVIDLIGNDFDIDGDTLTLSGFSQPANGMLVDNADGTLAYTPGSNFCGIDSFSYTINDGNGGTADGTAMIVVAPVGDTPQVTNVSTTAEVQSGLIFINRNAGDGPEVSHFKISGISNGSLYLADGVTGLDNGDFISVAQGQAGVRYTPAEGSTADGSFKVESSQDGVSVASQSGIATSIITVLTTAPPPAASEPSPPLAEPEPVTDEDVVEEEAEATDDLADETDVSANADDIFSVAKPQSYKAPSTAKPSFISGIADHNPANSDSDDKTLDRSTLLSPQSLKMLLEAQNLGELKTALGKLNITTLSSADYELVRNSLDAIKEEIGKEILLGKTVLGSAMATTVGLSAGYVVWMLKGGSLLASVLSSLPAWQLADPLAILVGKKDDDDDDDESLETIIKEGSGRDKDKKRKASELNNLRKDSAKR